MAVCVGGFERGRRCLPQVFLEEEWCVRFCRLHVRWYDTFFIQCLRRLVFVTKLWFWCWLGSGNRKEPQEINTAGKLKSSWEMNSSGHSSHMCSLQWLNGLPQISAASKPRLRSASVRGKSVIELGHTNARTCMIPNMTSMCTKLVPPIGDSFCLLQ